MIFLTHTTMKKLTFLFLLLISGFTYAQQDDDHKAIADVLQTQQKAWNDGNIETFMQGYWNNESLTFIGKSGVTKGWTQTLNNYKKSFPDKAIMGKLAMTVLSTEMLSADVAYVIGKWNIKRDTAKGDIGGYFTLVFKKIDNRWVIVSDHTS
jgi:uncharacterized protein (TIGR02246 family)